MKFKLKNTSWNLKHPIYEWLFQLHDDSNSLHMEMDGNGLKSPNIHPFYGQLATSNVPGR